MIPEPLSQPQAAALAGITDRRLRQIETEQTLPRVSVKPACYDPEAFGAWLKRRWIGEGNADGSEALDATQERAALDRARREIVELELARKRGELLPAGEVERVWLGQVAAAKSRLLALPSKLAGRCAGLPPHEIEVEARAIVHECLTQLASDGEDG